MAYNNDGDGDGESIVDIALVDNLTSYFPPLLSSYNDNIRPIFDTIDMLRILKVMEETIPVPTIVVAGVENSGKSSIIESLVGISLPCAAGETCTRAPLIMRLQNHPKPWSEFLLKYEKKSVPISSEMMISEAINEATMEIAGEGKRIVNVPLTLVVKKKGIPDLTIIDLPGVHWLTTFRDQPEDIYQQSSDITKEYIKPKESIILSVSCVGHKLSHAWSYSLSSKEHTEERILAVITKCDQLLDDDDDVFQALTQLQVRHGYSFVRNRIDDETKDEAQIREATLFEAHPLLSKIEKSMVGIPALANRLVQIQLVMLLKCFPDIVNKINEGINALDLKLNHLPNNVMSKPDGLAAFMHSVKSFTKTLETILIKGEYNEYVDCKIMHCNARLIDMLDEFSENLHSSVQFSENFLVEEMQVLEETNGIWLPHFLPHAFWIKRKMINVSNFALLFVKQVWRYLEIVCVRSLIDHYGNYPHLFSSMRKATHTVMEKMKFEFMERVVEMIEMEKTTYYTCDPDFIASLNELISNRKEFMTAMCNHLEEISMEGHGTVNVKHLFSVPKITRDKAFDLKMKMTAYWKIVLKRMVDRTALRLRFMIHKVVNKEMEMEIVNEVMMHGGGIEKMSEELSSTGKERVRLQRSIGLLQKSKQIMEQVSV